MSLGLHSKLNGLDKDLLPAIIAARPSIFVGVGDSSTLPIMKVLHDALGNSCVFVFRDKPAEDLWQSMKADQVDPQVTAQAMLDHVHDLVKGANPPDHIQDDYAWLWWQGFNEPQDDLEWVGEVDYYRAFLFQRAGLRVVIGSCSRGRPEPGEIIHWDEALRLANGYSDQVRLALHFYWPGSDPKADYPYQLGRWQDWQTYCAGRHWDNVIEQLICTEFGAEPAWRAQGMTPEAFADMLSEGDHIDPWIRKAVYDLSSISDDGPGKFHAYGIQENFIVSRRPLQVVRPIDLILGDISSQGPTPRMPGSAPAPAPAPAPVPPALETRVLNHDCYLRATPEKLDDLSNKTGQLGANTEIRPGRSQGQYTEAWIADALVGWVWTAYLVHP